MLKFFQYTIVLTFLGQNIVQCIIEIGNISSSSFIYGQVLPNTERLSNESIPTSSEYGAAGINFEEFPGRICNRECQPNDQRICYFKFVLEHYQAMGVACRNCLKGNETDCNNLHCIVGDGYEKGVMSINRQIPGPDIQVCQNDIIVVDVANMAAGTAASIHWHGLHMRATPWMDGVPFVTQCPIQFSTTFRYQFVATEPGTQFYHSHAGHHKVNGQYGALIIRQPILEDPHVENYDFDLPEHHILISDWMHQYGEELFPGLPSSKGIFPDSILINGRGSHIHPQDDKRESVPPTRYYVTPEKRYRFRVINSISHACPAQIQVEGHRMIIIASDSYNVQPLPFDTLVTNAGERYDFVLETNQPPGDYWVRVKGLGICSRSDTVALLRYLRDDEDEDSIREPLPDMPRFDEKYPTGVILNHPSANCLTGVDNFCVTKLTALEIDSDLRYASPDFKYYLSFENTPIPNSELFQEGQYPHFANLWDNLTVVGSINSLSLVNPDFPPLTQHDSINRSLFCDQFNVPEHCLNKEVCQCVHLLSVRSGSIVELIVVDRAKEVGNMHHPFHLHGHKFLVTGLGQHPLGIPMTVELAKEMEKRRGLPRQFSDEYPPWKDTVSIPSYGYAIIRFRANNPGYWLMHCHYEMHIAIGMGLIVQVGQNEEMVPPPPNFPRCGNYLPDLLI